MKVSDDWLGGATTAWDGLIGNSADREDPGPAGWALAGDAGPLPRGLPPRPEGSTAPARKGVRLAAG